MKNKIRNTYNETYIEASDVFFYVQIVSVINLMLQLVSQATPTCKTIIVKVKRGLSWVTQMVRQSVAILCIVLVLKRF